MTEKQRIIIIKQNPSAYRYTGGHPLLQPKRFSQVASEVMVSAWENGVSCK